MSEIEARSVVIRRASRKDLPIIVGLLADDEFSQGREDSRDPLPQEYYRAFEAIDSNPNDNLIVAEATGTIVGTLQLTFLPCLVDRGGWRAQIEGVRIASMHRGLGLGRELIGWAIDQARQRGCRLVQLTSNKRRLDAIRFYRTLGFEASHAGLKLTLSPTSGGPT
jgi:ribosomal protein S18 acetylase RimI-like enzyme